MSLDTRKVAHITANRDKIRTSRTETVVLVYVSGGSIAYSAVGGVVFHESGAVTAGVTTRSGEITRTAYDAIAEFPSSATLPASLKLIARTATPTQSAVQNSTKFTVLDTRRLGLGTVGSGGGPNTGNRWTLRLRRVK